MSALGLGPGGHCPMIPDALAAPGPGTQWVRDRARRTRACMLATAAALATVLAAVTFSVGSYFVANLS